MNKYDDIINMPHHVSKIRKPLSIENRSAQFAPFSCLTGYDKRIREVSREKVEKKELDDEVKLIINEKLWLIKNDIKLKPAVLSYCFKAFLVKSKDQNILSFISGKKYVSTPISFLRSNIFSLHFDVIHTFS